MTDDLLPGEGATWRYGSVCSGIEAATVAWHPLGWEPAWFAEIESFPSAVLAHHYPAVPNLGDITAPDFTDRAEAHGSIDVLVGGTPCQSFSVAGLRAGLADPRGNLALVFLAIADRLRPRWVVWENVLGVLSSAGGRDFGAFVGGLGELGYGWSYRVLDAQYFGVAQRRRRVFVVGHLGDWRRAAAVLFERASLSGHPAPRRTAGARVASLLAGSSDGRGWRVGSDEAAGHAVVTAIKPGWRRASGQWGDGLMVATAVVSHAAKGVDSDCTMTLVAHSLRADGFDASEDGTGRGTPLVVAQNGGDIQAGGLPHIGAGIARQTSGPVIALQDGRAMNKAQNGAGWSEDGVAYTLDGVGAQAVATSAVWRLTPVECARLQGFPDDYLDVPYKGKPAADGPRYRALGNSMAVPVMRWIGERITHCARQPALFDMTDATVAP